jgi:hypothetical protein
MTPPDTNLEKQRRRHRPALYAMAFVVFFAFLTLVLRVLVATDPSDAPLDADPTLRTPIDGPQETTPANPPREPGEE